MERREHPRIQIPLVVELTHPSVGKLRTTARDISKGAVFVSVSNSTIQIGAKLKLQLLSVVDVDNQSTPTVEMQVKRVTDEGLGLAFLNRSGEHLWSSVERLRSELHIGRDYFQVMQSIAIMHETRGVLLLQHNGKWRLPGHYLQVGQQSIDALRTYIDAALGIKLNEPPRAIATDSNPTIAVPEAATLCVIYSAMVVDFTVRLPANTPFSETRWIVKPKDLLETTFASDFQRDVASEVLGRLLNRST